MICCTVLRMRGAADEGSAMIGGPLYLAVHINKYCMGHAEHCEIVDHGQINPCLQGRCKRFAKQLKDLYNHWPI